MNDSQFGREKNKIQLHMRVDSKKCSGSAASNKWFDIYI